MVIIKQESFEESFNLCKPHTPPRTLSMHPNKPSASTVSNDSEYSPSSPGRGIHSTSSSHYEILPNCTMSKEKEDIRLGSNFLKGSIECEKKIIGHKSRSITCNITASIVNNPLQKKGLDIPLCSERNVTFSPTPSNMLDDKRVDSSPKKSQFVDFPMTGSILGSPVFLGSPGSSSLSITNILGNRDISKVSNPCVLSVTELSQLDEKSEVEIKIEKDRSGGVTPTNFAIDFGKVDFGMDSCADVLSLLHSPAVNSMFSPGGLLLSCNDTPRGRSPRTPCTPKTNGACAPSPNQALGTPATVKSAGLGVDGNMGHAWNTIICVSPLSSKRNPGNEATTNKFVDKKDFFINNFTDVFASPNPDYSRTVTSNELPILDVCSNNHRTFHRNVSISPNSPDTLSLDAVNKAEKEVREDEDLNILLKLSNAPRTRTDEDKTATSRKSSTQLFRPPRTLKASMNKHHLGTSELQLPFMGKGQKKSPSSKVTCGDPSKHPQKLPREYSPQLITSRSSSSSASQEIRSRQNQQSVNRIGIMGKSTTRPSYPPNHTNSNVEGTNRNRQSGKLNKEPIKSQNSSGGKDHRDIPNKPYSRPVHQRQHSGPPSIRYIHGPPPYQKHPMPPHMHPPPPHSIYARPHQHLHHPGISGYPPYHYTYPSPHPLPPHHHPYPMYAISHPLPNLGKPSMKISQKVQYQKGSSLKGGLKRPMPQQSSTIKKQKKNSTMKVKGSGQSGKKSPKSCGATIATPELNNSLERQKAAAAITAMNAAAGHKNDKAAALAAAILRGVTMRPSGKWQAQLYYAGKSRYIGVFDTREKAALAYEIAREKLKTDKSSSDHSTQTLKETETNVNAARKAAFEGVNEKDPRLSGK